MEGGGGRCRWGVEGGGGAIKRASERSESSGFRLCAAQREPASITCKKHRLLVTVYYLAKQMS